jgi:hypothetical protein
LISNKAIEKIILIMHLNLINHKPKLFSLYAHDIQKPEN